MALLVHSPISGGRHKVAKWLTGSSLAPYDGGIRGAKKEQFEKNLAVQCNYYLKYRGFSKCRLRREYSCVEEKRVY